MKRYRDPTPALQRREPELPRSEWFWCILIVTIFAAGAIWVSVHLGHHR